MVYFKSIRQNLNFNLIDKITLGYIFTTLLYQSVFSFRLESVWVHVLVRIVFVGIIAYLAWLSPRISSKFWLFIRNAYPLILFGFFYAETDYLNNIIFSTNLDPLVEKIELVIFGFNPSVAFSHSMPQVWFSELMNFGYFSYYALILLLPLWLWIKGDVSFTYTIFIITFSFYIFYWIFILFPVAGPQFYLDESFRTIPNSGLFRWLVRFAEWIGEGPTAAFPSSHVGIMVVMAILSYRFAKILALFYIFFGILICFSTIYIKAHYAVDVIGGLVFAPALYIISNWIYCKLNK
mgnify:CR=1 FL=1